MIFLVPVAAAGYVYYKKKLEEMEKENGQKSGQAEGENASEETGESSTLGENSLATDAAKPEGALSASRANEDGTETVLVEPEAISEKPRETQAFDPIELPPVMIGALARFNTFTNNLKKEFEKAEARKGMPAHMVRLQEQTQAQIAPPPALETNNAALAIESQ